MSNGDAHSHVTQVDLLDGGDIILTVQFDGFKANEDVEISGYVMQVNEAYSPFYYQTKVPGDPSPPPTSDPSPPPTSATSPPPTSATSPPQGDTYSQAQGGADSQSQGPVEKNVKIDGIAGLQDGDAVMVVTRVAKVWPTVLAPEDPETVKAIAGLKARWIAAAAPPWGANW